MQFWVRSRSKLNVYRAPQRLFLALFLFAFILGCDQQSEAAKPTVSEKRDKPNILLILLDDLGMNDVGAYGGGAGATPNIDKFAHQGVRYTRHYTDSTCTATRVAMLTGMDPVSLGFRPAGAGIPTEIETLPERLKAEGYSTHHIGKWHAGSSSKDAWPNAQGFDTFFGFLNQFLLRGPHPDGRLVYNRPTYRNPWLQENAEHPQQFEGNLSRLLNDRVLAFLEARTNDTNPWFLNYWTYAPHQPLEPSAEFLNRHEATPRGRYLALLEEIDFLIGEVLLLLDESGMADNTLVMIASDNGGTANEFPSNAPFQGTKASFLEGGVRTPLFVRWPGKISADTESHRIVSVLDYLPTLADVARDSAGKSSSQSNFLLHRENARQNGPPLFWEAGNASFNAWSVLDETGRWRLNKDIFNTIQLTDLEILPGGKQIDLSSAEATAIAADLTSSYTNWHQKNRQLEVQFVASEGTGVGQFLMNDFTRTPGMYGWTFAIAIEPEAPSTLERQIIAAQEPHWSAIRYAGTMEVKLQGLLLSVAEPPPGQCTEVIIGAEFNPAYIAPKSKSGVVELFYDGVRVASASTNQPRFPTADFTVPTYIGSDATGSQRFIGQLGMARFWNEQLVSDSQADKYLQNGIGTINGKLCDALTKQKSENEA